MEIEFHQPVNQEMLNFCNQEQQKNLKLLGSITIHSTHSLWKFNPMTLEMSPVGKDEWKEDVGKIGGIGRFGVPVERVAIVKKLQAIPGFLYESALNVKNAKRKFAIRMRGLQQEYLEHLRNGIDE